MTIASTINRNNYTGNGAVDTYNYTFRIFNEDDLTVTVRLISSGLETTLVKGTDYTVTGVGELSGGTVVLVNNSQTWLDGDGDLKNTYAISIRRVLDLTQETDIRNQGDFYPEAHEDEFDRGRMIDQQQQDEIDRAIKLPESIDPDDFDGEIPATFVGAANRAIITNSSGDGWELGPSSNEIANAQTNATNASASATLAEEWATKTNDLVATTDNSAKAYAIGGTGAGQPTGGDAKSWATKTSASVAGGEFSSKEYAQGSQAATGGSSKNWAQQTGSDVTGAAANSRSAKSWAQDSNTGATLGGSAKDWAQHTASTVDGTNYSSKEHAVGTQTRGVAGGGSAKDWANYTGGTVDNSEYSAKKYATDAANTYSQMAAGVTATQSISNGGTVTTNNNLVQNRKVQGNGGAVSAATLALGSSTSVDGIIMRLIGQSDTNTVALTYSDTNYGMLLNGDCILAKGNVLTLLFDLTALRWYELSRNF